MSHDPARSTCRAIAHPISGMTLSSETVDPQWLKYESAAAPAILPPVGASNAEIRALGRALFAGAG